MASRGGAPAQRHRPGADHGLRPGPERVRGWRVLEDNVRNPSGAAYAIAIRDLMDACLPELPRPPGLLSPASALPVMRECLLAQPGRAARRHCSRAGRAHRPGSSTDCWQTGRACCWSWPTT